jgi:hypothetical protein
MNPERVDKEDGKGSLLPQNRTEEDISREITDQRPTERLTPDQIERQWYEHVYQGDRMPQLTLRAVIMGMLLGGFMSLSNLYVGLKTG